MARCRLKFGHLLCLLVVASTASLIAAAEFEGFGEDTADVQAHVGSNPTPSSVWDDDEFEGFESRNSNGLDAAHSTEDPSVEIDQRPAYARQEHFYYEILVALGLIAYAINIIIGKRANEHIALCWARTFVTNASILERNFSLLGPGDAADGEVLMKESNSIFKFYASGRRYCQSLLATLDLKARHDLIRMAWNRIRPRTDIIDIEIKMNDTSMPPIVLAVAIPDLIKSMPKASEDLKTFTKQISVPKDRLPYWPSQELQVLTEHSSVFYDIFCDPRVEAVFSSSLHLFRSLHFTSEGPQESAKKLLKFSFILPPADDMQSLQRLMSVVPVFIDLLGGYKMSSEVLKKATKVRGELAERAFKDSAAQRQEALQLKKMERLMAERDRIARMTPEARAKFEEKQQRVTAKGKVKYRMLKS